MTLLSLDLSLNGTGWTLFFPPDKYQYEAITFKATDKRDPFDKMVELRRKLKEMIMGVSLVFIEDYSFSMNHGAHTAGEIGGMVRFLCRDLDVPYVTIPITSHKLFTTGAGNSKKDLMLLAVYKSYGVEVTNDNVADSYSIMRTGQAALAVARGENPVLNQKQQQAIKKLVPEMEKIVKQGRAEHGVYG